MMILILLISFFTYSPSEANFAQPIRELTVKHDSYRSPCFQRATEKERLMREAEENQYTLRRIEFIGNTYTRDQVLRDRMEILQEGNLFTRENLIRSLQSVSQLETLYPVKLSNVAIRLDRLEKEIDIIICFKEKRR
jgi:hypothetical protein